MRRRNLLVPILLIIILLIINAVPLLAKSYNSDSSKTLVITSKQDKILENKHGLNMQVMTPSNLEKLSSNDILDYDSLIMNKNDINPKIISNAFHNGLSVFIIGENLSGKELDFISTTETIPTEKISLIRAC